MKWVLLRGLGREHRHWHDFLPLLDAQYGPSICIDLPGTGDNRFEKAPLSIAGNTNFLRNQFLKLKKQETYGLLGISLGGMIALDWVSRFSEDFKKLVVINTSSRDTGHVLERLTPFAFYRISKAGLAKNDQQIESEIMKMVSNLKKDEQSLIDKFAEIRATAPVTLATLSKQILAASQFMMPDSISIPTLVLASLKDNMVNHRCSKQIATNLNAKIKIHPTAGHELTLDDPEWCVRQIVEEYPPG